MKLNINSWHARLVNFCWEERPNWMLGYVLCVIFGIPLFPIRLFMINPMKHLLDRRYEKWLLSLGEEECAYIVGRYIGKLHIIGRLEGVYRKFRHEPYAYEWLASKTPAYNKRAERLKKESIEYAPTALKDLEHETRVIGWVYTALYSFVTLAAVYFLLLIIFQAVFCADFSLLLYIGSVVGGLVMVILVVGVYGNIGKICWE